MSSNVYHILLVEDSPTDALLVKQALLELPLTDFRVIHVERLADAIAKAVDQAVDAILLDLSLPDVSGLDSFLEAHAAMPDTPIVILTGLHDREMPFDALRAGAQDYVAKETMDGPTLEHALLCAIQRQRAQTRRQ